MDFRRIGDDVTERPHVRSALPWLRSGPLWRVRSTATHELDDFLTTAGYQRYDLDGAAMTSRAAAHAELARVFRFPDWYGGSWDAFHDCWYGFANEHAEALVAVVWHLDPAAAAAAPATHAEVGWALLECATAHWPTPEPVPPTTMRLDLFAVGSGADVDAPDDPDLTDPPVS